jgi:hypothetical protein
MGGCDGRGGGKGSGGSHLELVTLVLLDGHSYTKETR